MKNNLEYKINDSIDNKNFIESFLSQYNINFCLNSLLSSNEVKHLILNGYNYVNDSSGDIENRLLQNWKLKRDIESYQQWFLLKSKERTYGDININVGNSFKFIRDKLNIKNEVFNAIFQTAIGDLLEDMLSLKTIDNSFVKNCKIYMTDKFDRLSTETDYILNITTDQGDHYYGYTIDLFRQHNDINMELKKVICNNFNLSSGNKSLVIDRYSIQIGDHDFILEYLSKYMDLVKNQGGIILSGDALKIIKFNNITSKIYN